VFPRTRSPFASNQRPSLALALSGEAETDLGLGKHRRMWGGMGTHVLLYQKSEKN
jgi:hypothetical protein